MAKNEPDKIFSREEILFLNQLVKSLEDSEPKLEEYYNSKNSEDFDNIKKLMLNVSKEISKVLEQN